MPRRPIRARIATQIQLATGGGGVTRLELFLDLVFVYAFLNVTNLMSENLNPRGLLQGALVVLLLWRCWISCAWLGNVIQLDRGLLPPIMVMLTTAILLISIAIPEAFTDQPGGLPGPLVFAISFLLVRLVVLVLATEAQRDSMHRRGSLLRAWTPVAGSASLLLLAALLPAHLPPSSNREQIRLALFLAATVVDYISTWNVGAGSWQVVSTRHWAERHSLIMLIALGETIISIGTSRGLVGDPPITWSVIGGSLLAIVIVAVLWWTYFDIARPAVEQALEQASGVARSLLGRDAYVLLHLPMIGGLILLSLGFKHGLSATEGTTAHDWDALSTVILYSGVGLYLLGLFALEWRSIRLAGRSPLLGIVLVSALLPLAIRLPVLGALALLAAATTSLVVADRTVFRRRHRSLHEVITPTEIQGTDITPKELFFDLVFVYTFIQVIVLMARQPSVVGLVHGLTVLALLWWVWCHYAWLGSAVRSESGPVRLAVLVIVALTLVLGLAIPQAFSHVSGGLPGPLIVVTCYLLLRILHISSFWLVARRNPGLRRKVLRAAVPAAVAVALLLYSVLAFPPADEPASISPIGTVLWVTAALVELGGGYLVGRTNWQIRSVEHWTERYALIILIAFGEVVISTGLAVADQPISGPVTIAITLSVLMLSTLWWVYFGIDAILGQRIIETRTGLAQWALARDAYTYLHLPMVVGLVSLAYGLRTTLALVADRPDAGSTPLGHVTLFGGVVVYLLADQLFWWRIQRPVRWVRVGGALLVATLTPATMPLPALWALGLLTTVSIGLVMIDSIRSTGLRRALYEPPTQTR
ncbi:hypothetical protein GCM10027280_09890 [Micromonospora polyrhachis]